MNTSIMPYEEYRQLLRKKAVSSYKVSILIFIITIILLICGSLWMLYIGNNEEWYVLLIPAGILFIVTVIWMSILKGYNTKTYNPFNFEQFKKFESIGTKVPMYRVVSTGRNSITFYMLLDISNEVYQMYDIGKKSCKLYFEGSTSNTYVKFFYKLKSGLEVIKPKIQIFVDGKKYSLYGYSKTNELFLNYLKNKGLKYEVQIGRNKSL